MSRAAPSRLILSTGSLASAIDTHRPAADRAAAGLWKRDPEVWSRDPVVQGAVAKRLGWLGSPAWTIGSLERLAACANGLKRDGFTDAVLLGMGGSSLAPEVLRAILGVRSGWLRLHVLDSTDPAVVRAVQTRPGNTLYLLASKSGTTLEPNALAAYFRRTIEEAGIADWAGHFIAITDDGTPLAARARRERFRDVFINPSDIGGRYSALSFFGMVPAALMGQDVEALLNAGMAVLNEPESAVTLGLVMGAGAKTGRDKLTLLLPPNLKPFGLWVEQLVAESTGKQGVGIVPVVDEDIGEPGEYGSDRLFVRLRSNDAAESARDSLVRALEQIAPVASTEVPDPSSLGAEFVRWEIATAIAGALLGINPFDEPNVQQAKDATTTLLNHYKSHHQLPTGTPDQEAADGVTFRLTSAARERIHGGAPESILTLLGPTDYLGVLAYLAPDVELSDCFDRFRRAVRRSARVATTLGYGPRYLHSTGQLHKGGPNSGVFVLITAGPRHDAAVPGEAFSLGTLELAQALGDFASLDSTGRRALHVHLDSPDQRVLAAVLDRLTVPLRR